MCEGLMSVQMGLRKRKWEPALPTRRQQAGNGCAVRPVGKPSARKCSQIARLLGCEPLWRRGSGVVPRGRLMCHPWGTGLLHLVLLLPPQMERELWEEKNKRGRERHCSSRERTGVWRWPHGSGCVLQGSGVLGQSRLGFGSRGLLVQKRPPQLRVLHPRAHSQEARQKQRPPGADPRRGQGIREPSAPTGQPLCRGLLETTGDTCPELPGLPIGKKTPEVFGVVDHLLFKTPRWPAPL